MVEPCVTVVWDQFSGADSAAVVEAEAGSPQAAVGFQVEVAGSAAEAPAEAGDRMKTKHLFSQLDHDRIVAAIGEAEKHTSGEIRLYVSHRKTSDPQRAAARHFVKLGMNKTKCQNAVLIFLAPESQNFAIIGDEAIHSKCGQAFWEQVAGAMSGLFQQSKFTEGIVHGIETAGKMLAEHFPAERAGHNELPDSVVER
jgi:uncharacterized membrane protein